MLVLPHDTIVRQQGNKGWSVHNRELAKKHLKFEVGKIEIGDIIYYYKEGVLLENKRNNKP